MSLQTYQTLDFRLSEGTPLAISISIAAGKDSKDKCVCDVFHNATWDKHCQKHPRFIRGLVLYFSFKFI